MNGYDRIKQIKKDLRAKGIKTNIPDLLALSNNNDPFYCGSPTQILQAEWFSALWSQFGFDQGSRTSQHLLPHLRRIHYRVISQETPIEKHNGMPYENTDNDWHYFTDASKFARYLGLVDPELFVDRRNPDPLIFRDEVDPYDPYAEAEPVFWTPSINTNLGAHGLNIPKVDIHGYDYSNADQPYHVEIWIEKSTMNDILIPLCREMGINLVTSLGFQSIVAVLAMIARVLLSGKPARIAYISDQDPAGDDMPLAVARQVEFWLQKHSSCEVKLEQVVLTKAQCVEFGLPRCPIKEEDRRKEKFEERFGEGATELDALEALHPGELEKIIRAAVSPYIDESLPSRLRDTRLECHEAVQEAWEEITEPEQQQLDSIHEEIEEVASRYQDRLQALADEFNEEMAPFDNRLDFVSHAITKKSEQLKDHLIPRPEPETGWVDESEWLFDSDREYLDQLKHYKFHQDKTPKDLDL